MNKTGYYWSWRGREKHNGTTIYNNEVWLRMRYTHPFCAAIGLSNNLATFDYYEINVRDADGATRQTKEPLPPRWKGKPVTPYRLRMCKRFVVVVARLTENSVFNEGDRE